MTKSMNKSLPLLTATMLFMQVASADWILDPDSSSISFTSVKNGDIVEGHVFNDLSGQVETDGTATIAIDLDSVDTQIPIRDERMREMLFEVAQFPEATFEASIPLRNFADIEVGQSRNYQLSGSLSLHGNAVEKTVEVLAIKTGTGRMTVNSVRPVVISAAEFALSDGIQALTEVAGLNSISPSVPVSFSLLFVSDSIKE